MSVSKVSYSHTILILLNSIMAPPYCICIVERNKKAPHTKVVNINNTFIIIARFVVLSLILENFLKQSAATPHSNKTTTAIIKILRDLSPVLFKKAFSLEEELSLTLNPVKIAAIQQKSSPILSGKLGPKIIGSKKYLKK